MDVSLLVGAEVPFSTVEPRLHRAAQISKAQRTFNQKFPDEGRRRTLVRGGG
jgi:hypothetical protein